ncbi:MAG: hypothetical protein WA446_02775 [Steroidobacteraceae bacterium]
MDQDTAAAIIRKHGGTATPEPAPPGELWVLNAIGPGHIQGPAVHKSAATPDVTTVEMWMFVRESQRGRHFNMTAEEKAAFYAELSAVLGGYGVGFDLVDQGEKRNPGVSDLAMFRVLTSIPDRELTDETLFNALCAIQDAWNAGEACISRHLGKVPIASKSLSG